MNGDLFATTTAPANVEGAAGIVTRSALHFKCRRCKRALKNPIAQQIGYGSTCAKKLGIPFGTPKAPTGKGGNAGDPGLDLPLPADQPFIGDVKLWREGEDKRAMANIPRTCEIHSPDGFEWGYGGSGPAELALNILAAFVPPSSDGEPVTRCRQGICSATADRLHQDFKRDFIAGMPEEGGTISGDSIREWLRAHA